jgi:pantetheine-phosphate adenylyltransferase
MRKGNLALYPGTFDPPTFGHLDLIGRASRMFDRLLVAVAMNNAKACMFSVEERTEMLHEIADKFDNVEISSFSGLTVDYARERGAVAIVRGLRAISDFEFELTMAITNQKLNPSVDTVCLMPSEPYLFLSSRLVKEIAQFGGDLSAFLPEVVKQRLQDRLR